MDDFGSILERDYGLGRAGKGRIGSRNGKSSNIDTSSRFSESFGRNKFGRSELGGSFRGWNDRHSSPASSGYGGRSQDYQGGGASYAVYDEVFSSNLHSTIPIFEDVFRVPSSRMKVSEMRDNDIFRGIPSLKKSNSRVTYEDIFGEPPDDFSGPFSFADVKNATGSSRTNSSLGTPRKAAEGSKVQTEFPQPVDTAALKRPQGSFLAMSSSKQNGLENPPQKQQDEPCRASDAADGNGSTTMEPAKPRENSFVSVEQVSLTTRPSEIPPPARIAPDRAEQEPCFETIQSDSGPPPQRSPPPLVPAQAPDSEEVPATNRSSELLERVLKESSAHAELSIREKVLDWQKHNWAEVEKQKSSSTDSSPRSQSSSKSRSETLIKLRAERAAIERIAAEVEAAAAEQAKLRAERAAMESVERDDAVKGSHQPGSPSIKGDEGSDHATKKIEETFAGSKDMDAGVNESGDPGKVAESDVATSASEQREEQAARSSGALEEEAASTIVESSVHSSGSKDPPLVDPEGLENAGEPSSSGTIDKNKATDNTDSESIDVSIDSFTTNHTKREEEAAPETPERLETTKKSNQSSNNSGEEGNAAGAGGDRDREASAAKIEIDEEQQRAREEEARRARERSLVARITAEVRERAALEAKAKAEKAALDRKKESEQRRTKPRIIKEEVVAKELEDRASPSSFKGGGGGGARISLREQLEKERLSRLENSSDAARKVDPAKAAAGAVVDHAPITAVDQAARIRAERSLVERMRAEARERAANARVEREREDRERERLERIDMARKRERERLERLEKERERERERLERELEREREIEREKDRVGLEEKAAKERAEAARLKMERAAVERANAEARARAERAAYEAAVKPPASATTTRPTSVQRFGNSASMPSNGSHVAAADNGGMRRTTSSTSLENDRNNSSTSTLREGFKEFTGETPERRKARLERYQRTLNRAAQALAQKNKRDLELQSEQAERQRLAEKLDSDIKRWSVGKDGNIRALLSTLQYVLWPESGWKQVSLTELINPTAVKKAYRRATLCVHPDKMQQKNANVQQKYIAEKVFHILQVAWNKFNSQETI